MSSSTWRPPAPVSIFVSSTFRDMQLERDAIRDHVLPRLEELAARHGTTVSIVDLRWGIDTTGIDEAGQERRVMHTCLDEIRRCRPFFLALVGQRYGYVPDANGLRELSYDYPGLPTGRSMTELEIAYGLEQSEKDGLTLCCVRTISNISALTDAQRERFLSTGEDLRRQEELRSRVRQRPDRVREYQISVRGDGSYDLDAFCSMLTEVITQRLGELWGPAPEDPTDDGVERGTQGRLIEEGGRLCIAREEELRRILAFCDRETAQGDPVLLVTGASGMGKTTLLARAALELRRSRADACVVAALCGRTYQSSSVGGVTHFFSRALYDENPDVTDSLDYDGLLRSTGVTPLDVVRDRFARILGLVCQRRPVILVIDAVDELETIGDDPLAWLPDLPDGCRVVCSAETELGLASLYRLGGTTLPLAPLDAQSAREVARGLAREAHKTLPEAVLDDVAALANGQTLTPLHLALCLQVLLALDERDYAWADERAARGGTAMGALTELLRGRLADLPAHDEELLLTLLERAAAVTGLREETLYTVLVYLAVTRFGLRDEDLLALFGPRGLTMPDLTWFRRLMGPVLVQRESGKWDLSERVFRTAIMDWLSEKDRVAVSTILAGHFLRRLRGAASETLASPLVWEANREVLRLLVAARRHVDVPVALTHMNSEVAAAELARAVREERATLPQDSFLWPVIDASLDQGPDALMRLSSLMVVSTHRTLYEAHTESFASEIMGRLLTALEAARQTSLALVREAEVLRIVAQHQDDEERGLALMERASERLQRALKPDTATGEQVGDDELTISLTNMSVTLAALSARAGDHAAAARAYGTAIDAMRSAYQRKPCPDTLGGLVGMRFNAADDALSTGDRHAAQLQIREMSDLLKDARETMGTSFSFIQSLCLLLVTTARCMEALGGANDARPADEELITTLTLLVQVSSTAPVDFNIVKGFAAACRRLADDPEGRTFLVQHERDVTRILLDRRLLNHPIGATADFSLGRLGDVISLPGERLAAIDRQATSRFAGGAAEQTGNPMDLLVRRVRLLNQRAAEKDQDGVRVAWRELRETLDALRAQAPTYNSYLNLVRLSVVYATWLEANGDRTGALATLDDVLSLTDAWLGSGTTAGVEEERDQLGWELLRARSSAGTLCLALGRRDEARSKFNAALGDYERLGADEPGSRAALLGNLARTFEPVADADRSQVELLLLAAVGDMRRVICGQPPEQARQRVPMTLGLLEQLASTYCDGRLLDHVAPRAAAQVVDDCEAIAGHLPDEGRIRRYELELGSRTVLYAKLRKDTDIALTIGLKVEPLYDLYASVPEAVEEHLSLLDDLAGWARASAHGLSWELKRYLKGRTAEAKRRQARLT